MALSRPVYVSSNRSVAIEELAAELAFQTTLANRQPGASSTIAVQDYIDSGVFHLGSPEEVAASLHADPALAHADELIIQVGHHGPGHANTLRCLELFREIASSL